MDDDQKMSCELANITKYLVNDGETSNNAKNNMCDIVHKIATNDNIFALEFQTFKIENDEVISSN